MTSAPSYNGLDQNYDFIYEALLEGATVYLRIANYYNGLTGNLLVTSWILEPGYGLILVTDNGNFEFTNGSYHTANPE